MSMYNHCLYFNLSALNRKISKIWQMEFEALGLSPSHGYLLYAIVKSPDISHKELSQLLELDASTITRFLESLEAKGLIIRSSKGKGAMYLITGEGKALSNKIDKLMDKLFKKMQKHFGVKDFVALVSLLQSARISLYSDGARSFKEQI